MTVVPDGYRMERGLLWPADDRACARVVFDTFGDAELAIGFCRKRDLVVQAGGNCGVWARNFASKFDRVVTFEPDPKNFRCLSHNTADLPNVARYMAALGDKIGTCDLDRERGNCGAHALKPGDAFPVVTLDSLDLPALDLLYLDIEGAEPLAIKGAWQTIHRFRPVIAIEDKGLSERFGYRKGAIVSDLEDAGWDVAARPNRDVILRWRN